MFPALKTRYLPISGDSDDEDISFQSKDRGVKKVNLLWTITNIGLSLILFVLWLKPAPVVLNKALRQSQTYSPIIDRLDLNMHTVTLNGTLWPNEHPSIARQSPNPIADAIWEEWELTRPIPLTADQVRAMGKDPKYAVKLPDEDFHLGDDVYVGVMDVFHQLHCLNTLRRIAYADYYNERPENLLEPGLWYPHINHCVDMLAQTIQCSGNMNLITMQWMETQLLPFPDFSIQRQCVDFEKIVEWRKENSADVEAYRRLRRPKDFNEVPAPDAFWELYGQANPHKSSDKTKN